MLGLGLGPGLRWDERAICDAPAEHHWPESWDMLSAHNDLEVRHDDGREYPGGPEAYALA